MTDTAAWLTAIGTVGAFAVALMVLGVQVWDHHRATRDHRMAQARLVAAWLDDVGPETGTDLVITPVVILVRNASSEPVYDVVVKVDAGARGGFVRRPGTLGPGETREFVVEVPGYLRGIPSPEIVFVDSAGRRWVRDGGTGRLKLDKRLDILQQHPGAYQSVEAHPTLGTGHSVEAQHGRRVSE